MSVTATDPETGQDVELFVRLAGGFMDAIIRADTREHWLAAAEAKGLAALLADPASGAVIDEIGAVVITPAEIDPETFEVVIPAVLDTRFHLNLRMPETSNWLPVCLEWMREGAEDIDPNRAEEGRLYFGVTLIDPDTIQTAMRVWL